MIPDLARALGLQRRPAARDGVLRLASRRTLDVDERIARQPAALLELPRGLRQQRRGERRIEEYDVERLRGPALEKAQGIDVLDARSVGAPLVEARRDPTCGAGVALDEVRRAAPRDSASRPSAPLPAKRSRQRSPARGLRAS